MHRTLYRLLTAIPVVLQFMAWPVSAWAERISGFSADDTLTIRASEARMDEQSDIIHFAGGFELQAKDWYLSSEQATLYGKLDDPETVTVTGSPARILINARIQDRTSVISGEALHIVYQRDSNSIRMEGGASLSRDGQTMNGGEIAYDIAKDLLSAGGSGGVHIRVKPEKSKKPE
jgi:lipopolysaccharide transport protein LptA